MAYLADVFADKGLSPQTNAEKASYYRWLFFAAGPVEQASALIMLGIEPSPEQQAFLGCGNPMQTIDALAKAVSQSTYITGERFTAADVYVSSHIGYGLEFGKLEKRPEFVDYWSRVSGRAARVRALEQDNALLQK
jgi:glutathione S-transferase